MKHLFRLWTQWGRAKPIPMFTNFLIQNPWFRRAALGYHETKTEAGESIDKWLEKELLTKEQYDRLYPEKRIGTKANNSTTSGSVDDGKYTNRQ